MADYDYDVEPRGVFFAVDNKSFYASVEASMRGWDPLDVCLVVMSEQENTNGGLILATSPEAKRRFNLRANVSRQRDLPEDASIKVVPPRMNLYIKRNLEINNVFRQFVADEDLWPYSIDESILDLTKSWRQFGASPVAVAQVIQHTVYERFGLYVTVGIGENPAQAKIALDIYAKHAENFIGQISYATVPQTIWCIKEMTSVWSIGRRTAEHLRRLGITNMNELAHANPYMLKQEMGMIGAQLFALSWGIDRAELRERVDVKSAGFSNSQVLPRDYDDQHEIELVIKEIGEQLASRLRGHEKLTASVSLSIGFSYGVKERTGRGGFHQQLRLDATNDHEEIVRGLTYLFRKHWHGEAVRNIAVAGANLSAVTYRQLNLFVDPEAQEKKHQVEATIDDLRHRFGFKALVYARSTETGGTALDRAALVGGHNGGNAYD
ncbi:Y-family DNA polymerase [Furfurilactobacillus entadae]|uniref:Y-family DNA polymerase n=1 Tax=Furfurilactobacillus entadae TaxID=2922307 RepID=UPI0035E67E06